MADFFKYELDKRLAPFWLPFGLHVHFGEPVPSPLRRKGHSAVTVTVADLEGLVARLDRPA
jgi:hypothetical protein